MCIMKITKFYADVEFKAKKNYLRQVKNEVLNRDIVNKCVDDKLNRLGWVNVCVTRYFYIDFRTSNE